MVAAASTQHSAACTGCDYHDAIEVTTDTAVLQEMALFHEDCLRRIRRRIALLDTAEADFALVGPVRNRRGRSEVVEGGAIAVGAFSFGLIALAGLAHCGRLLWDLITG